MVCSGAAPRCLQIANASAKLRAHSVRFIVFAFVVFSCRQKSVAPSDLKSSILLGVCIFAASASAANSKPMDSDGDDSPKQSIRRKNKPVAPILLSDDPMGEGSSHSWELSDSGNLKDRNMAINDHGVSIVTSDACGDGGFDGMSSSDGDRVLSAQSCETRTQTFPAQASDFVVLETIGTGSSSYVRKVVRKRDNRIMALKCINVCDPSLRDSIISEIRMQIANMKSKHVVMFHAAFYSEGVIAIVLDLASSGSLGDIVRLRSRPSMAAVAPAIPEPILAFMIEQVLMGLLFIHKQQHQVHRDFKPSNLLLDHSGRVLLSDFGTATSLDNSTALCGPLAAACVARRASVVCAISNMTCPIH